MSAFDILYYNDSFIAKEDFRFSISDRAFQYGDGLFETMHAYAKEVQFIDQHWGRLQEGLCLLKLPLDKRFTLEYFKSIVEGLLHRCRLYQGVSVKVSVWRNAEGKYIPRNNGSNILIEASYLSLGPYELNSNGLLLGVCQSIVKPVHPLFSIKSKNGLFYILAGLEVAENGWDDGLILNDNGMLVEATSSNLFLLHDKALITPTLSSGCVHGVMRRNIIELAPTLGLQVVEKEDLKAEDLINANEVFITNAVKGLQWVSGYENKRYLNRTSKKLTEALNKKAGF